MSLIIYLIRVLLISGILYSYYWLILKNKNLHQFNRYYLLGSIGIATVLPIINMHLDWAGSGNAAGRLLNWMYAGWEKPITIHPGNNSTSTWLSWTSWIWAIYILGAALLLFQFFRALWNIHLIEKSHPYQSLENIRIYHTNAPGTPFSFFSKIFWNEEIALNSEAGKQILEHEFFHIRQKHSIDLLIAEIVRIFYWFNPFFHLLKTELKAVHEFVADQHAISSHNRFDYAELLLWQTAMPGHYTLTQHFFNNQIKRRIFMITSIPKSNFSFFRRALILPVIIILFFAFSRNGESLRKEDQVFTKVEVEADYPGGQSAWQQYLSKNLHYPQEAVNNEIQGDVNVQFVVDRRGIVSQVQATSGPMELRAESIRIIMNSGKWIPASNHGELVNCYKIQPIKYRLEAQ